jgi:carbon monoxide dehydrogenase subunit G
VSASVTLAIRRHFSVPASSDAVFDVLADVPCSVSHFPKVKRLEDLGQGVFRWTLEDIAALGMHHQVVYACRYSSERRAGTVEWTPVAGQGNAAIAGAWSITRGERTHIDLRTEGTLQIPVPGLLAPVVALPVRQIFEGLIDEYLSNLGDTFDEMI